MKLVWLFALLITIVPSPGNAEPLTALPAATSPVNTASAVPQAAPAVPGPEATSPDGKIWMRLHLVPGQVYAAQYTIDSKEKLIWNLKPKDIIIKIQVSYLLQALPDGEDNESRMRLTFSSLLIEGKGPDGFAIIVDTLHPSRNTFYGQKSAHDLPFDLVPKSFMGQDLILHLSPTAEIIKIEGLDKLMERIAASLPGLQRKAEIEQQIANFIRYSGFKDTPGGGGIARMLLPARLIDKGDSWESSISDALAGAYASGPKLITAFKVSDRYQGVMTVNVKNYVKPNLRKSAATEEQYWVNGDGVMRIDEKTGWTLGGHLNTKSKSISSHRRKNKTYIDSTVYSESETTYECTPLTATPPTNAM